MNRTSTHILLGLAGLLLGCGAEPKALTTSTPVAAVDEDVASVERAFAKTMVTRDFEAFQSFLAEEAVFLSGDKTLRGKREVAEVWKRFFAGPVAPFSWEPERVEVLGSAGLAFSTGPVRDPDGNIVAVFNSVWRKEPAGWRLVFDRGVDLPECPAGEAASPKERAPDYAAYRASLKDAQAAYERKDYAGFLAASERASAAMPNSPRAIYNAACGYALTGKPNEAIALFEKLVGMHLFFDVKRDDDLASLRELPPFAAVVEHFAALDKTVVGKSMPAFTIPERDFIPEGIARDPKTGAFFVGSVHKGKIVRILPDGKSKDFATKDLFAVLGMAVDEERRALWACTSALPEWKGFKPTEEGRAKLVEFDLDSGKPRREVSLGEKGTKHACNDLAIAKDGSVFVSDPGASTVWVLPAGRGVLETFLPSGTLTAPQGIALSADGQSLFLADYSRGLFHVDRNTRQASWLMPPSDATLAGIDGLTMQKDDLIAIQNGVRPHRVLRLVVDVSGKAVRRAEVLQMNHPAFNEPTLGVVVGKELFYVANSQWGSFDKGVIWPLEKLKEPVILKLGLE